MANIETTQRIDALFERISSLIDHARTYAISAVKIAEVDWMYDTLKRCRVFYQSYANASIVATPLPQLQNHYETQTQRMAGRFSGINYFSRENVHF